MLALSEPKYADLLSTIKVQKPNQPAPQMTMKTSSTTLELKLDSDEVSVERFSRILQRTPALVCFRLILDYLEQGLVKRNAKLCLDFLDCVWSSLEREATVTSSRLPTMTEANLLCVAQLIAQEHALDV